MNQHIVNMISNRLSLRHPQRRSVEILDFLCDIVSLEKGSDIAAALNAVKSEFPQVEEFEREFPSLCFALATGVGKTRLMGAFISYLYLAEGIRHFFVLAPNLTIYNKLITDFTPNTPKYVFQGIGEFSTVPPLLITGDNYEDGHGARRHLFDMGEVHVNIFNISKINSEVRGGNAPRIKRLSEYIGESYFDYLAGLDDLVMLMDESHRYRASAGVRAINDLNPILGLELTATPQVERGQNSIPFKNVVYSYPLSKAMIDGYVKEPAVATRKDFNADNYTSEGLEKLKLEDGVRIHENTKVELEVYARNSESKIVKPFMLVVASDTTHADSLQTVIEDDEFFDGRYRGKVIQVHSNLRGEVKDEVVQQLLTVEDPSNPVEIVIHVNMLKEGWDVTNLYTIVPLRAANSRTLVEQSIGRGLRLPYGKRVGVSAVDRLTIVSHDKFQEIVDHANDPDSIIRTGVVIGEDIPIKGKRAVKIITTIEEKLLGEAVAEGGGEARKGLFEKPEEQAAVRATLDVIKEYEHLRKSAALNTPEIRERIVAQVEEAIKPTQRDLELKGLYDKPDVAAVVQKTTEVYAAMTIDIPRIIIVPAGEMTVGYQEFDLDLERVSFQPVEQSILIQHLRSHDQFTLADGDGIVEEQRPEDYLVRGLVEFNDICYDDHAGLLYKLAGQVVGHLRGYLANEDEVVNVLQFHQYTLVSLVHSQMQAHYTESATEYEAKVSKGFNTLKPGNFTVDANETVRDFRALVENPARIRSMIFGGFKKSLYPQQKFDSDPERRFAVVIENDESVIKWVKPSKGDMRIHYSREADGYEPDFVVETVDRMYLCEPKRKTEMTDEVVLAKAKAAATWCGHATLHCEKPWSYLLIPHDQVDESKTISGLAAAYMFTNDE